jgi:hypothetical protein
MRQVMQHIMCTEKMENENVFRDEQKKSKNDDKVLYQFEPGYNVKLIKNKA